MAHSADVQPINRLGVELLDILLSCYLLRFPPEPSTDSLAQLRELKVISLLSNDVILRLGKFRDDDNRSWSFTQAAKALRKKSSTSRLAAAAEPIIEEFLQCTKRLEDYRNLSVAHIAKRGAGHLQPLTDLYRIVGIAVRVVDELSGGKQLYTAFEINLREQVLGEAAA